MYSGGTLTLNLMVDKSKNRVVFADCGADFVDILLSFLTLPMATIIHLAGKDFPVSSIHNLYDSVKSLDSQYYRSEACKNMLLLPIDFAAAELRNSLPINFRIAVEGNFLLFYCHSCFSKKREFSLYMGAKCSCGEIMIRVVRLAQETTVGQNDSGSGVFFNGLFRYMITDDCVISKASVDDVIDLLQQLDSSVRISLEKREVHVDASHVLNFLVRCLVSNTPLTDVFLSTKIESTEQHKVRQQLTPRTNQANAMPESSSAKDTIKVKLLLTKIDNKVIHAEGNVEFVNLLFSFLSYPAGYIIKPVDGQMNMMGNLGNIYKSIETLSLAGCFKSKKAENIILNPKSPPFFNVKNGLIKAEESDHPKNFYTCLHFENCLEVTNTNRMCKRCGCMMNYSASLINPKLYPSSETNGAFLKDSSYIVNDDLSATPLSSISAALNYLKNGEGDGVETIIVKVGEEQALALLKASITSTTALTDALLGNNQ